MINFNLMSNKTSEKAALIRLYNLTNGAAWTNKTNWLTNPDISTWYGVTLTNGRVTNLSLSNNNLIGDISNWSPGYFKNLIYLYLFDNTNLTGNASKWLFTNTVRAISLYNCDLTGDISSWKLPSSLQNLFLTNNGFSGDLSGWSLPSTLLSMYLQGNGALTGNISSWIIPANMTTFRIHTTHLSGAPNMSINTKMASYTYNGCMLSQADVDGVIASIYARKMAFTAAAPVLSLGGTNSAPSGVYQVPTVCPALTGKERIYDLVNDSCVSGHKKWTVTYTA